MENGAENQPKEEIHRTEYGKVPNAVSIVLRM